MTLSLKFLRALMPCVVAGVQALVPAGAGLSAQIDLPESVIAPASIELVQKQPVHQLTYADYRRRLIEARASVEMGTVDAAHQKHARLNLQI